QGPAHAPSFEIEARVANFPAALAKGGSKQAAEQAAAQILLDRLATDDGKNDG
ncbi:MAG: ribonuclease III, partial [Rhodospirillaceae bacterium]|nr:ribonuclease III [Rhodospirillaceae bacterium]